MDSKKSTIATLALTLVAGLISLIVWHMLPDQVPTHWNASGQADAFGARGNNLMALPFLMAVFAFVTYFVPSVCQDAFDDEALETWFGIAMIATEIVLLGVHIYILRLTMKG